MGFASDTSTCVSDGSFVPAGEQTIGIYTFRKRAGLTRGKNVIQRHAARIRNPPRIKRCKRRDVFNPQSGFGTMHRRLNNRAGGAARGQDNEGIADVVHGGFLGVHFSASRRSNRRQIETVCQINYTT